jgi:hypothetical protein
VRPPSKNALNFHRQPLIPAHVSGIVCVATFYDRSSSARKIDSYLFISILRVAHEVVSDKGFGFKEEKAP